MVGFVYVISCWLLISIIVELEFERVDCVWVVVVFIFWICVSDCVIWFSLFWVLRLGRVMFLVLCDRVLIEFVILLMGFVMFCFIKKFKLVISIRMILVKRYVWLSWDCVIVWLEVVSCKRFWVMLFLISLRILIFFVIVWN